MPGIGFRKMNIHSHLPLEYLNIADRHGTNDKRTPDRGYDGLS